MIVGVKKTYTRSHFHKGVAIVKEVTSELHATKGWRVVQRRIGTTTSIRMPLKHETFKRGSRP